jgi:putative endonuclease
MDTKELGNLGEKLACEYLVKNGYKILGKNYRINLGEIDIIARKKCGLFRKILRHGSGQDDKTIHFVEVKALSQMSSIFSPEQRANWKKQNKVKTLAEIWLSKNKVPENTPYQIDIIAVSFSELGQPEIKFFGNVVKG